MRNPLSRHLLPGLERAGLLIRGDAGGRESVKEKKQTFVFRFHFYSFTVLSLPTFLPPTPPRRPRRAPQTRPRSRCC